MTKDYRCPEITDFARIGSAVGNAFHSGISFEDLWLCFMLSETAEQLDAAVSATIRLKELKNDHR